MERLERLELLAKTDELDGHARDRLDGERGTAAGIAVELRHDDTVEAERIVERLRDVDGFWPVIASTTSRISCGWTSDLMSQSSCMSFSSIWRRPPYR